MRFRRFLLLLIGIPFFISCSHSPAKLFHERAQNKGLIYSSVVGEDFRHALYANRAANSKKQQVLNIYIGSDGSPWLNQEFIKHDPTPTKPVLLDFVAKDHNPAIYLGRPCYHLYEESDKNCMPSVWTSGRYSTAVVKSLVKAISQYAHQNGFTQLRLIGFSGGGTLAMLMPKRLPNVETVITMAANLDHMAWTKHHRYLPLSSSLNVAKEGALPAHIQQIHFVAGNDKNVLPVFTEQALSQQVNAQIIRFSNADHNCCWNQQAKKIMQYLEKQDISGGR